MSRRKQSIPCKVQGVRPHSQAIPETSLDIVKLHTMTDSLLDVRSKSPDTKGTLKEKTFPHSSPALMSYMERAERILNHNNKYSNGNGHVQSCGLDYSMSALNTSHSRSEEETQPRHPAWVRARSGMSTGEDNEGCSPKKRNYSEIDSSAVEKGSVVASQGSAIQTSFQGRERTRTVSSEEELICPICHRGFMSKYGLLSHLEIHSTPELKCAPCDLRFSTRTEFVNHQVAIHQTRRNNRSIVPLPVEATSQKLSQVSSKGANTSVTKTYNVLSGFNDLSIIDFSCKQFPAISEGICSESLHRLTERDSRHFFLCKSCNYLYPTLSALQVHMAKFHASPNGDNQRAFQESSELKLKQIDTNGVACVPWNNADGFKLPSKVKNLDLQKYPEILGLAPKDSNTAKVGRADGNVPVDYDMDDGSVRTSPMLACLQVPRWMRESETTDDAFDLFNVKTTDASKDRPSLKMKIVRRREERESITRFTNSNYYIYDEPGTKESKEKAMENFKFTLNDAKPSNPAGKKIICKPCGGVFASEAALACHRLGSMCGIGIRTSGNGKKMFWCRLCNYTSFEKSTILRHQRTHTGVRPYTCRLCEIAFTTKANCERHIRKRHSGRVTTDMDVKNAVHCDYGLMKKAREGEIDISAKTKTHANRYFNAEASFAFHFECRLCEATFTSRGNGTRHVIAKHGVAGGKHANDVIKYVEKSEKSKGEANSHNQSVSRSASSIAINSNEKRNFSHQEQKQKTQPIMGIPPSRMPKSTQVPKLTPLHKIKAYYEASTKMLTHFQRDYDEAVSFVSSNPDPEKFMSKVLSLLHSTSIEWKDDTSSENKPQSVFTPIDAHFSDPSVFRSASAMRKENSSQREEANSAMSINEEFNNPYNEGGDEDVAQRFVDRELNWDYGFSPDPSPLGDSSMQVSPSDESSFKPWKNASSALMLRHFAANGQNQSIDDLNKPKIKLPPKNAGELSSVTDLIKFAQESSAISLPEKFSSTEQQNHFSLPEKAPSNGNESRGKYQMVVAKSKPDNVTGEKAQPSLTWKFIPEPPKTRDERGRYIRDPNSESQLSKSYSSISSYKSNDDRPTMVSMKGKKFHLNANRHKSMGLINSSHGLKGRKCPKCGKSFPWASSLSRHIMTHTGYKPYMCARCSMRFTTRSNLLRHAYRRHGLERGSEERHNMLVTLSMNEQKEYADQEAQKIVEMGDGSPALSLDMDEQACENNYGIEELVESKDKDPLKSGLETTASPQEGAVHCNKRYICGLCKLPFANRSNLVRHLYRLHHITKDYPNFKALLIKIHKKSLSSLPHDGLEEVATFSDIQERTEYSPPPTMVNGLSKSPFPLQETSTPPTMLPSPAVNDLPKIKPFTCAICAIGFTKRNNCARHIQHQHSIDRKSARLRSLIIRNDMNPDTLEEPQKVDPVFSTPKEDQISVTPPPLTDSKVFEEIATPSHPEEYQETVQNPTSPPMDENTMKEDVIQNEKEEEFHEDGEATEGPHLSAWRSRRRQSSRKKLDDVSEMAVSLEHDTKSRKKNIRLTQFVCGVCKRIYKTVAELKEHLNDHNIPHPWHCPICDVPFTNKYNCQRHLFRRHGSETEEPKYVEDLRNGPRIPRKRSKTYGR